jgi:hypothetical protein
MEAQVGRHPLVAARLEELAQARQVLKGQVTAASAWSVLLQDTAQQYLRAAERAQTAGLYMRCILFSRLARNGFVLAAQPEARRLRNASL